MDYRLITFNCARPAGAFSQDNEFVQVFVAMLPSIFAHAAEFDPLHWHQHGIRSPKGDWFELSHFGDIFPYPPDAQAPDVCTMAGWRSLESMQDFIYKSRPHGAGMKRLAGDLDRSAGASLAMWWAPRGLRFSMDDGFDRLERLRRDGPSDIVFDMSSPRSIPEAA